MASTWIGALNVRSTPAAIGSTVVGIVESMLSVGEIAVTVSGAIANLYGPRWSVGTGLPSLSTTLSLTVIVHSDWVGTCAGRAMLATSEGPTGQVNLLPLGW